jgi:tetratricopeptide (TPR) repeat protein
LLHPDEIRSQYRGFIAGATKIPGGTNIFVTDRVKFRSSTTLNGIPGRVLLMTEKRMLSHRLLRLIALICAIWTTVDLRLRAEDEVAEVMEALNRQIAAHPRDGSLLLTRSHLYTTAKKFDLALADLDKAQRLGSTNSLDRERAEVYLAAGWYETGLEFATRYVNQFPNEPDGYRTRARLRAKLARPAEAGADYAACIQRTKAPSVELYLEHAAALTTEDGAYLKEALAVLERGIAKLGHAFNLEVAAMEVELQQKNFDAALKRVDALIVRMPRKDTWLAKRGDILVQAGRFDQARKAYEEALDAIAKLPPVQKQRAPTATLERQVRQALMNSGDLAAHAAKERNTRILASVQAPPTALSDGLPAATNTPSLPAGGKLNTYFIAAEEVEWDYAPGGDMLQEPFCGDPDAFLQSQSDRIGHRYKKAIYRGYTDETFQRLQVPTAHWRHLGMLGPLLRAEVGDELRVVFKNKTRFPASIHPHGVFYLKTSEGSGYSDGTTTSDKKDDVVQPGATFVYDWLVPERAGPGPNDGSSLVWLYHSHAQAAKDANAGLIGAIIITAKGKSRPDGTPNDVDCEFVTLFNIYDENRSSYFDVNLKTYLPGKAVNTNDLRFIESNLKHTINGYIFANLPMMTMQRGERVRWYLLGMGSEADLHSAHWHGNTVLHHGYRTDVVELLPASMKVADMVADNAGIWMFHCHVNDHMVEGMSARYEVLPQHTQR